MCAPARVAASSPFAKPSLMSPEFIVILAVGVALGGVILQGLHGLDKRIDGLDGRIDGPEERLLAVEAGQEEIRGQLTIIRDHIAGRNMRPDDPRQFRRSKAPPLPAIRRARERALAARGVACVAGR